LSVVVVVVIIICSVCWVWWLVSATIETDHSTTMKIMADNARADLSFSDKNNDEATLRRATAPASLIA
jgi:hypothetical protein